MSQPPEATHPARDMLEMVRSAMSRPHAIRDPDGHLVETNSPDPNLMFWAGQDVASESLSAVAACYARLAALYDEAQYHLPPYMVETTRQGIQARMDEIRMAVASKNSETIRRDQATSCLQDKLSRHRVETVYQTTEDKGGFFSSMMNANRQDG